MAGGQQVCRQVGSWLYNRTAAVWVYYVCADPRDSSWKIRVEVWTCLSGRQGETDGGRMWEGWESETPVVISLTMCVQESLSVITVCTSVWVCVCVFLTTAPCHYHPWLLITGATWPVEVHLGSSSHLSHPCSRLKLIKGLLSHSSVQVSLCRLLISMFYNVFTLVNQLVKKCFAPVWKLLCNGTVTACYTSWPTGSTPVGTCCCREHVECVSVCCV